MPSMAIQRACFIRKIFPGDIVGEIRDNAFQVTLEMFCRVMNVPRTNK